MSLEADSRVVAIKECFELVPLTARNASHKRIVNAGKGALDNICKELENLRNENPILSQSLDELRQTHYRQAEELSTSASKCTELEEEIVRLRGRIEAQQQQITEKNQIINEGADSLQNAFSTELTRREVLLDPISKIISDGIVAKAKEESQRSSVFDFDILGEYTHEKYVEERMSKSAVAGQVGDEKEKSLAFLIDMLSDAIDTAHQEYSPSSESAKALVSFYNSIAGASSSSSSSAKRADAISAKEDWEFDKYMRRKESALATISALILKCVDSRYSWEYGWLLAAEVKKLSESERLSLILSRTVPAPTGTQYINACKDVVERQEKKGTALLKESIKMARHDNISSALGYIQKCSRGGIQQSKKRNPIATALTIDHYTLRETSGGNALNPMQKVSNNPNTWPIERFTEQIPESALTPTGAEMKLLEYEWKASLLERIDEVIRSDSFDSLPPIPTLKKRIGKSKGGGGLDLKCFYCKVKWKNSKRTCFEPSDKATSDESLLAAGEYDRLMKLPDADSDPLSAAQRESEGQLLSPLQPAKCRSTRYRYGSLRPVTAMWAVVRQLGWVRVGSE